MGHDGDEDEPAPEPTTYDDNNDEPTPTPDLNIPNRPDPSNLPKNNDENNNNNSGDDNNNDDDESSEEDDNDDNDDENYDNDDNDNENNGNGDNNDENNDKCDENNEDEGDNNDVSSFKRKRIRKNIHYTDYRFPTCPLNKWKDDVCINEKIIFTLKKYQNPVDLDNLDEFSKKILDLLDDELTKFRNNI